MILKLDPTSFASGGTVTPIKKSVEQGTVRVDMPKDPPKDLPDFSSAGLPELDASEGGPTGEYIRPSDIKEVKPSGEIKEEPKKEEVKVIPEKKDEKLPSYLKAPIPKKEEVKEEKKEAPVKTEVKTGTGKIGEKLLEQKKGSTDTFDYSKFAPQEVTYLKNMSREAREFTGKLIQEHKEFSKAKDGLYLQHPNAYTLSPEYTQINNQANQATAEARYWEHQLELCKEGKEVRDFTGYDPKTGEALFSQPIKPNNAIEEKLRMNVHTCMQAAGGLRSQLQQFPQRFQGQIKQDMHVIEQEKKNRFAWYNNPEILDMSIVQPDGSERVLKDIKSGFTNLWPAYMRNDPRTEVAGDLMVALAILQAELHEANGGKKTAETKVEEQKRVEPSSSVKPAAELETIGGVREFSSKDAPDGL